MQRFSPNLGPAPREVVPYSEEGRTPFCPCCLPQRAHVSLFPGGFTFLLQFSYQMILLYYVSWPPYGSFFLSSLKFMLWCFSYQPLFSGFVLFECTRSISGMQSASFLGLGRGPRPWETFVYSNYCVSILHYSKYTLQSWSLTTTWI